MIGLVLTALLAGQSNAVEPTGWTGSITLATPAPVLGVDAETEVTFRIDGPLEVAVDMPRCLASVGRLDELVRVGPREFTARYVLPSGRYPQAAILAAEWPPLGATGPGSSPPPGPDAKTVATPLRAFVIVPLRAAASVGFRTDPGAQVTVTVAERDFGPHLAGADGLVRVAVVVPPGVKEAHARSVSTAGRASEQVVDLAPPDFPRLLWWLPPILAAGQPSEIVVHAVDVAGRPLAPEEVLVTTSNGPAEPLGGETGAARFLVTPPGQRGVGTLALEARLRGAPEARLSASVPIGAGPPARLHLQPDRPRLPIGTGIPLRLLVSAEDAFGNPTNADDVEVFVDGIPVTVRPLADGRLAATIPAPERPDGRARVGIEAMSRGIRASTEVPLVVLARAPSAPRPAPLVVPDPRSALTVAAGTLLHLPASAGLALWARADRRPSSLPAWPRWLRAGVSLGYLRSVVEARDPVGETQAVLQQLPVLLTARAESRQFVPFTFAAVAGLGWDLGIITLETGGYALTRARLGAALSLGAEAAHWVRGGFAVLGLRYLHAELATASGSDGLAGAAGGLALDFGYRIGW